MIIYTKALTTEVCFKNGADKILELMTKYQVASKTRLHINTLTDQELGDLQYIIECVHEISCDLTDHIESELTNRKHIEKVESKEMVEH